MVCRSLTTICCCMSWHAPCASIPGLNASLDAETIRVWRRIDIGLAVDTDRGLLVPVVRDVGSKGVAQLAAETTALVERARAGKCAPDELRGGHLHADQPGDVWH